MEPEARYTIVGAFVLGGIAAMVLFILWISEATTQSSSEYAIYFREQNLDGLQINSNVTMKGIKVGSVSSVAIAASNIEEVRVVVRVLDGTPLKSNTLAVIQRNLLTGLASIDLVGSTQGSPSLTAASPNDPLPIIPEGRSRIDVVAKSLPDVFANVSQIAERVNAFLTPENQQALASTLKNVERFSGTLADDSKDLKLLIADARGALQAIEKVSSAGATELTYVGENARVAIEQLRSILVKVDATAADLSGAVSASSRVLVQQFQAMAQGLTSAARDISASSQELREIPKLLYGASPQELGPGEKLE